MSKSADKSNSDDLHRGGPSLSFFRLWVNRFTVAWMFLTRVPLPSWWNKPMPGEVVGVDPKDKGLGMIPLSDTVQTWPFVGLFVGAFAGSAVWAGAQLGLHPMASAVLGLMVAALITGALHEDGLADVADGFGGGRSIAKKLEIMKDSYIGTYGVLTLILVVGFKVTTLGSFNGPGLAAGALVGAHVLSRAALPLMMSLMTPAREGGLGTAAGIPTRDDAIVTAIIGVLVVLLTLGLWPGLLASILAAAVAVVMGWTAKRQIGGFTGDVLGATEQLIEAAVLAGLAVAFRTVFYT
ncbi:adenosylcobinamide-GDP ribazoletransferase [Magnetovibrio sp. PR-2]|uniref:adenosylcobinamide-GDP ribazoletransferase n=1 Tax=Magnetovibrio sp. PR-2 TaxID=3120356 RepID=UPI002FCE457D